MGKATHKFRGKRFVKGDLFCFIKQFSCFLKQSGNPHMEIVQRKGYLGAAREPFPTPCVYLVVPRKVP
jgi:hypothetical protein